MPRYRLPPEATYMHHSIQAVVSNNIAMWQQSPTSHNLSSPLQAGAETSSCHDMDGHLHFGFAFSSTTGLGFIGTLEWMKWNSRQTSDAGCIAHT